MADTAALVVALSAQLTKFEKDMKAAGIMADKAVDDIEKKFSSINPTFSGSFLGTLFSNMVTKGIEAATKALLDFKDRFLELDKQAKVTGESMEALWGFQEAAKAAGASTEDALKGLREMANLLNQMKRGQDNSLSELLDANPQALAGFNRSTLTVQQTWQIIANLVRDAKSEFDKIDIARLAGFSEDMVKALEQGGDAMKKTADAAAAAAPNLTAMTEQAKLFDGYMKSAVTWLKAGMAEAISDFRKDTINLLSFFERVAPNGLGGPAGALLEQLRSTEAAANLPRVRIPTGAGTSNVPVKNAAVQADDFDRATKSIEKHTTAMQAEAATMGESAYAQEEFRVQLALTEALVNSGKEINEQYADSIATIAERAARAKQSLAEQQFALQRINQASQTLGSAISTAFADAIVEGKKLNEVLDSLVKTLLKAAINSTIMSIFTPGAGGGKSPFASAFGFAGGTDFAPGGLAIVGERGPELVNLPRGSQVIPNDVLRQGGSQGGAIVYSPAIDARGASVEAVARLAQVLEQDRATFASRTVATIQQARRSRLPGV